MESGRDERSEDGQDGPGDGWLEDVRNWDDRTRRQFLAVLITTVSGILTTLFVFTQGMFDTNLDPDDGTDGQTDGSPPSQGETETLPVDVFVREYDAEYRAAYANGEILASGSDGWDILDAAVGAVPSGSTVYVKGRYEATFPIEIEQSIRLEGEGASISVADGTDTVFSFRGTERYRTELDDDADTGEYRVELDTTDDITEGDLLLIEDEDGAGVLGRGQPPGEPHSVLDVDGSTVTLEDTVVWREGYDSGTLVYVVDPIEIHCSGFELSGPAKDASYVGIIARQCRDSTFENLHLDKFGNRGIAVEAAANTRIRDCTVLRSADIEASDGYGIQVRAGCHDVVVEGCTAKECRHPFSVTPAGPREVASRSLIVRDCFVSADGSAALNCHGGSAHDINFNSCVVHTWGQPGVRTGAQKTGISGCEFRMDGHHAITTRNDGQEMVLTVSDTDVYGATNAVTLSNDEDHEFAPLWKLAHIDGVRANGCRRFFQLESGNLDRVRNLVITNCNWDSVGESGIRIENRVDGGSIEGNTFGAAREDSHIYAPDGDDTTVTNLHILGNRFQQFSNSSTFIRLWSATQCVVSDNVFESESGGGLYSEHTDAERNIIKQNTYFAPRTSRSSISAASTSMARNNEFVDTS